MIWAFLAIFAGGIAIATQAPINARLASHAGDGMAAAAISFGVGFVLLAALTWGLGALPAADRLGGVPWWAWTGGVFGAFYVWAAIWSVGTLGVVTLVAGLILGQMTAALVLDASGAFGLPVHAITPQRLAAIGLVAAGVVLSRF